MPSSTELMTHLTETELDDLAATDVTTLDPQTTWGKHLNACIPCLGELLLRQLTRAGGSAEAELVFTAQASGAEIKVVRR